MSELNNEAATLEDDKLTPEEVATKLEALRIPERVGHYIGATTVKYDGSNTKLEPADARAVGG